MILVSTPTLTYSIFIITQCINSYIILTSNLGDFKVMARKIIQGNVAEIIRRIIPNKQSVTKDASNDKSDDSFDNFKAVNFRRSSKTDESESEDSDNDEMIKEANRYVIEQLGKHIKERVVEDLVSKYLRNKLFADHTTNTQKGNIRNTEKKQQHKKKSNIRYNINDNFKESRENQKLQIKRWTGKNYAKNVNNEASEVLFKRKVPENKPTDIKRPRYTIKDTVKHNPTKSNEIFVILQPKVESAETNREGNDKKNVRIKMKPTTTTRKFIFIQKTRKKHVTPQRNIKPKEALIQKKQTTSDLIYENILLNTNYSNEYSDKDEKVKETKGKRIKSNRKDSKDKVKVGKESDVVSAVTSYLWVDGEDDDLDDKVPNKGNSEDQDFETTPNNFELLPTIVDKYDFAEPIPEKDRVREAIKTIRKPSSQINKKQKAI